MPSLVFILALLAAAESPQTEAAKSFELGRAALKAGQLDSACKAFDRSYTLEPALGSLLNLASCLEKQGKLAGAWVRYNDAIAWAQRTHEAEREAFARTNAQALKGRLSWLALSAAEPLEAAIDGQPLHLGPVAVSVPVEVGSHELVVEKPGFQRFAHVIAIAGPGTTSERVPALTPEPRPAQGALTPAELTPPPPPPAVTAVLPPASGSAAGPGVGLIVSGAVIGLVGGVGLVWSLSTYDTLQRQRSAGAAATVTVSLEDFNRLKWIYPSSWVALGGGAALAALGAIVLATANHPAVMLTPTAGPGTAGLTLSGRF